MADVLRASELVGVVTSLVWLTTGSAIQFIVLFGVLLVPRVVGVPAPFDVAFCAALLFTAWARSLRWYAAIAWLDIPVHVVAGGLSGVMLYLILVRVDLLSDPQREPLGTRRSSIVIVTLALGLAAGSLWELYEWSAVRLLKADLIVGYDDTIGGVTMDGLGSVLARSRTDRLGEAGERGRAALFTAADAARHRLPYGRLKLTPGAIVSRR